MLATLENRPDGRLAFRRYASHATYLFAEDGTLSSISDRNNEATAFSYTGGRLTTITDSSGRQIRFSWSTGDRVTSTFAYPDDRTISLS